MHKFLVIATALAGLGFAASTPASAQAARPTPGLTGMTTPMSDAVTQVQYRRGHMGRGGRHFGRPVYRGHRYYGGPRYYGGYRRGYGGAAGLGLGLATGAIIGGAIASQQRATSDAVAYCMSRFKSYDPRSGTYLGYDGLRHPCP